MSDHGVHNSVRMNGQSGLSIDLKISPELHGRIAEGTEGGHANGVAQDKTVPTPRSPEEIAEVLREFVGHRTYRQIGKDTGVHAESVRRYLQGKTRLPADFVAAVCCAYDIDPLVVLIKDANGHYRNHPRPTPEDRLTESLAECLRPQVAKWMRTNVVPFGMFLRQAPIEADPDDLDIEHRSLDD